MSMIELGAIAHVFYGTLSIYCNWLNTSSQYSKAMPRLGIVHYTQQQALALIVSHSFMQLTVLATANPQ